MDIKTSILVKNWKLDVTSSNGRNYAGSLMKTSRKELFFYRKGRRFEEVIAGFGDGYAFGIQDSILTELMRSGIDTIIIETEFNIFETTPDIFVLNCIQHPAIKGVSVCLEEHFARTRKDNKDIPLMNEGKKKKKESNKSKFGDQSSLF